MRPLIFFLLYPLDKLIRYRHTHSCQVARTTKGDNMANGKSQPTELTIEGVTLIFGEEMPPRVTGKGTTKYDAIVEAIREQATPGTPVKMVGVKVSGVAGLKKRYSDIHFETRGGKENPSVWATLRGEELVSS